MSGPDSCDISVVVTTYNRAGVLPHAVKALLRQEAPGVRYEVIVVDNNSTDSTREVVEGLAAGQRGRVRYLFEPQQGIPYGRNAGIGASRAPIVAITDDDVRVSANWVAIIKRSFDSHPEVDCIGGRVLPLGGQILPSWLTRDHWGPVALLDYGDAPFYVTGRKRLCLIGANTAFRRSMFERIGPYATNMLAVNDNEILVRLWRSGGQGMYVPELVVLCDIATGRLTKTYHRRWHERHGYYSALMHDEGLEGTRYGHWLGVPAWIYREAVEGGTRWIAYSLLGRADEAFLDERRFRFAVGFVKSRWQEIVRRAAFAGARSS